jgi:transcriptional regulator with XRE-family HTH domain
MTQAELGTKMEVSQTLVSQWEMGKTEPSKQQTVALKKILGGWAAERPTDQRGEETEVSPGALSAWLTRARLAKKMTVPELAEVVGLSAPSIYNIESGRISNPRDETIRKLERALGSTLSAETKEEIREEATIEGLGEFVEFDPHNDGDLPSAPGIYMLYDISERSIYVGQGSDIRNRIRSHQEKFWFKRPIVETAAYVKIEDKNLREKVEKLLIRFLKSNAVINKQNVER